jgi:hypothetical protein
MTTYTILNTAGSTVATINPATTTGSAFSIELPGQGYSLYGQIVDQDMFRMLENFNNATPPSSPVVGQWWYNPVSGSPNFWNGTAWIIVGNSHNSMVQLGSAINIDFTVLGDTVVFTHPGGTIKYYPTGLLLQSGGAVNVTTSPVFSMKNLVADDVMEPTTIVGSTPTKFGWWNIEGLTEPVTSGNSVKLTVNLAATGGVGLTLKYSAFLFGWVH